MATIAEFIIPAHEFALAETLEYRPEVTIYIDRVVAHNTTEVVPFVRVTHAEVEGLTEILEADTSVSEVELFGETDDERFYRLVWNVTAEIVGQMVNNYDATVQEATATNGEWHLRVLFPDREGLSATGEYADENEITLNVTKIYGTDEFEAARHNLTESQYEALATAVEHGYYKIPREIDTEELAAELGISHQALSERFRRATENLVVSALAVDRDNESSAPNAKI